MTLSATATGEEDYHRPGYENVLKDCAYFIEHKTLLFTERVVPIFSRDLVPGFQVSPHDGGNHLAGR
jgi:hypothetical protein